MRLALVQRHSQLAASRSPHQKGLQMSDSTIFLLGAIMYLIGLGAMLFKDEFVRLGLRLRRRA